MRARSLVYSSGPDQFLDRQAEAAGHVSARGRTAGPPAASVGSGCPLSGSAAKFGRPSLVIWITRSRLICAIQKVSTESGTAKYSPVPPRSTVRSFSEYAKPTRGWRLLRVVGTSGLGERRHGVFVAVRVHAQVVAQPEVQRQVRRHLPVVLQPRADLRPDIVRREVADADVVGPRQRGDRRQVPGVRVERIRKQRLDVRRRRSVAVAFDAAHAHLAVVPVVDHSAGMSAPARRSWRPRASYGKREIVADAPDVLGAVPRVERVAADGEAREGDARRSGGDAVGRLPVVRPRREVRVLEDPSRISGLDLVHARGCSAPA